MASTGGKKELEWIERVRSEGAVPLLDAENCRNGWSSPPADKFMVRGPEYLSNRVKVPAGEYLLKPLGFDWIRGSTKIGEVLKHPNSRVRKAIEDECLTGDKPFVWAFNLQVPSKDNYSAIAYFTTKEPIPEGSLMDQFLKGDDGFRNSRLKLIANIVKGPWIVRKAVGEQAICIIGRALSCKYCVSDNFLEVDVDIGSSMVASAIVHLAFGYITTLTVDLAFLIEGQTESELPEQILGAVRFSELDPAVARATEPSSSRSAGNLQSNLPTRLWKSIGQGFSHMLHPGTQENGSSLGSAHGNGIGDHEGNSEEPKKCMATNEVRRATMRPESSVYTRPVGVSSKTVCAYWIAGRCTKKFCRFLHTSAPSTLAKPHISNLKAIQKGNAYNATQKSNVVQKSPEKVCKFWVVGNCVEGDRCPYLHTWFHGAGFSVLAKLQGHKKAVTGIALPETSDKLYSAGTDGTVRVWDCRTGQCGSVINLGGEAGSLVSEGPWLFVGVPNVVKAWNIRTNAEFNLNGPVGQVHAMVVANEMLFAGAQDGVILVWKGCSESNPFQLAGTLKGHTQAVVCLTVGRSRLYSGSVDQTIRVWDLDSLQCIVTLNAHSDVVMSLICWDQFLLSCSLDCTIKVWVATGGGNLEVTYTHNEEHGVLALSGMPDAEAKPVLFCSCNDTSVRLYELPSFTDRGRLFGKREVRALQIGPRGLFFTGDATGLLSVWKWLDPALKELSS